MLQTEDACVLGNQPLLASVAKNLRWEGGQPEPIDGKHEAPRTAHYRRSALQTDVHLEEKL